MKKLNSVSLIILVLIIAVVIVVGAYFIVENQNDTNKKIKELEDKIELLSRSVENSNTNINDIENNIAENVVDVESNTKNDTDSKQGNNVVADKVESNDVNLKKRENNTTEEKSNDVLSGTYIRPDSTGYTEGTLVITNVTDTSFDFSIDVLKVTNMEKIDEGAVNIGGYEGNAIKIADGKYEVFDEDAYRDWGIEYKIMLEIKDSTTVLVIDDENDISPYCGAGVFFGGEYIKE